MVHCTEAVACWGQEKVASNMAVVRSKREEEQREAEDEMAGSCEAGEGGERSHRDKEMLGGTVKGQTLETALLDLELRQQPATERGID